MYAVSYVYTIIYIYIICVYNMYICINTLYNIYIYVCVCVRVRVFPMQCTYSISDLMIRGFGYRSAIPTPSLR